MYKPSTANSTHNSIQVSCHPPFSHHVHSPWILIVSQLWQSSTYSHVSCLHQCFNATVSLDAVPTKHHFVSIRRGMSFFWFSTPGECLFFTFLATWGRKTRGKEMQSLARPPSWPIATYILHGRPERHIYWHLHALPLKRLSSSLASLSSRRSTFLFPTMNNVYGWRLWRFCRRFAWTNEFCPGDQCWYSSIFWKIRFLL